MLGLSYWLMFYQNSTQVRREDCSVSDAPISVLDTLIVPDCVCLSVIRQSMQKSSKLSSQPFPSPLQKFVNNIPLDGKLFETRNGILIGVSQVLQIQKNRCTANTTTIQKVMMISSLLATVPLQNAWESWPKSSLHLSCGFWPSEDCRVRLRQTCMQELQACRKPYLSWEDQEGDNVLSFLLCLVVQSHCQRAEIRPCVEPLTVARSWGTGTVIFLLSVFWVMEIKASLSRPAACTAPFVVHK